MYISYNTGMLINRMRDVLPPLARQTESSSCLDADVNFGRFFLWMLTQKVQATTTQLTFELGNRRKVELLAVQKLPEFKARNYFIYSGEFTGFIGCSWSGELRRPLMLDPKGNRSDRRELLNEVERLFPDKPELYEEEGWYPNLLKFVIPQVVVGFEPYMMDMNMETYAEYLNAR